MGIGFGNGSTQGADQDLCFICAHNHICKYKEQYQSIRNDIRKESNKLACMSIDFRCNHYIKEQGMLRNNNDITGHIQQPYIDAIPTRDANTNR